MRQAAARNDRPQAQDLLKIHEYIALSIALSHAFAGPG